MSLNNYRSPAEVMKYCTGEARIESFKKISERLDKAASEIDREADKLARAMKQVDPQTEKLQRQFDKFFEQMSKAAYVGSDAAGEMRYAAEQLRDLTKLYARELRDATETASALENMYKTLAKAIAKADKTGNSSDKMKAEIAGKAYDKACKAAEKTLGVLMVSNKTAQKGYESAARFSKTRYLNSAETMDRILTRMETYLNKDEKQISGTRAQLDKAKGELRWVKDLSK